MEQQGYEKQPGANFQYDIAVAFNLESNNKGHKLIKRFNESAAMGFLPALRDSVHYVKKLHEEHGYEFHCITSMSTDSYAFKLRRMNLEKLFGTSAFTKLICLATGAPKDDALAEYKDSNCFWIEDKLENAEAGLKQGLRPILVEHGHNMNEDLTDGIHKVVNWKEIYSYITGEKDE
jgi:beta-phosphoglucomutase-like phosphatase (HAD superfamily)